MGDWRSLFLILVWAWLGEECDCVCYTDLTSWKRQVTVFCCLTLVSATSSMESFTMDPLLSQSIILEHNANASIFCRLQRFVNAASQTMGLTVSCVHLFSKCKSSLSAAEVNFTNTRQVANMLRRTCQLFSCYSSIMGSQVH